MEELVDTVDRGEEEEEDREAGRKLSLEFKELSLEDRLQTCSLPGTPRKSLPPSTSVRDLGTISQAAELARLPSTPARLLAAQSRGAGATSRPSTPRRGLEALGQAAPLPSSPLRSLARGVVPLTPVKNRVMGEPQVLRPGHLAREEEVLDLRKTEEQEEVRDFRSEEVLDLRKKEEREVQVSGKEEVEVLRKEYCDLRKEDSDDDLLDIVEEVRGPVVLMTPKKELVVIGNPVSNIPLGNVRHLKTGSLQLLVHCPGQSTMSTMSTVQASPSTTSFDWMVEQKEEDKEQKEENKEVQEVLASTGEQGAQFLDKVAILVLSLWSAWIVLPVSSSPG